MWMIYFNVIVIFDSFSGVNILNSVIYKFFSLQEVILVIKKDICFFGGLIYYSLHECCERLQQQLEEVKELGGS